MTPANTFAGKTVALFGLGGSGLSTLSALVAGGATVAAWDDSEAARKKAAEAGATLVDLSAADWSEFAALVLAPGVPLTHPKPHWTVERAKAAGVEVIGDIELFVRERRVARGKVAFRCDHRHQRQVDDDRADRPHRQERRARRRARRQHRHADFRLCRRRRRAAIHVIECSSFQIDFAPTLDPSVGLLINITPDHIDRHGSLENYAAIKERLVAASRVALIGVDDEFCREIFARLKPDGEAYDARDFAAAVALADVFVEDHRIFVKGAAKPVVDLRDAPALRGEHNGQNAAFAFAAARALGLSGEEIGKGLASFPGLAHRMEQVGRDGRVLFVNDSKATNADAAEKALKSFTRHLLDSRRQAERGRHRAFAPAV